MKAATTSSTGGPSGSDTTPLLTPDALCSPISDGSISFPHTSISSRYAILPTTWLTGTCPSAPFTQEDGRWFVGEEPLVFFHFSGYDPDRPWAVSKHLGPDPRVLFSERPDVFALCQSYGEQLRAAGFEAETSEYAYNRLPTGARVNTRMRRLYRIGAASTCQLRRPTATDAVHRGGRRPGPRLAEQLRQRCSPARLRKAVTSKRSGSSEMT